MIAAPAKNGTHHSKPRLAAGDRTMTMQEFAEVMHFGRCLVDTYHSDIPTFDAGMIGSWIMNHGDEVDQAEALLAIIPIARRLSDRLESKGGAQ